MQAVAGNRVIDLNAYRVRKKIGETIVGLGRLILVPTSAGTSAMFVLSLTESVPSAIVLQEQCSLQLIDASKRVRTTAFIDYCRTAWKAEGYHHLHLGAALFDRNVDPHAFAGGTASFMCGDEESITVAFDRAFKAVM